VNRPNHSLVSEFVFLVLSNSWEIQIFLFFFSCLFYMSSLKGNLLIVFTMTSDLYLHSPVYFLLANLSVIDLIFCSIAAPKMICDIFRKHKVIFFGGCIAQIFFSHAVLGTEMVLLISMAFDRYVAICKPLHYWIIMMGPWTTGLIDSSTQLAFVVNSLFCGLNVLNSFYCDIPRLIKLACTDTHKLESMVTAISGFISLGTFFLLIHSYIFLLATLQKHSSGGSSKALSTLSAHSSVVVLFFGPLIFFYVFDTLFINLVIYTFRNRDIKIAMRRVFSLLLGVRKAT
ncbi:OR4F13P-like, partial [Ictidomys tridecemlineatus]|uniref:Olfactory receptor n=1 Tax=Ictidomys tridecemlineatus TaxID=43179 RepID=A0A287CZ43_ICTTR